MASSKYTPLDAKNREIRLLTIQPSLVSSPRLRCKLYKATLNDPLQYQALSYAWGPPHPEHTIIINGESFRIRTNLHLALRRLRSRTANTTLWVDAICINQEDIPERNHQVARMRDIYEHAHEVIIWLGEKGNDSDLAIENIRFWSKLLTPNFDKEPASLLRPKLMAQLFDPRAWEATKQLFKRPWWHRVWVFQEVVVSRSAVLVCGVKRCRWMSFLRARTAWDQLRNPEYLQLLTEDQLSMISGCEYDIAIAMGLVQLNRGQHGYIGLLSLIRLMNRFEATDPRDKLYALLGVDSVVDITVNPDYEKTVAEVYTDFVRAFVHDKCRLSVLGGAGIGYPKPQPTIGIPSWVPDLRHLSMVDEYTSFSAAGQTEAAVIFSADSLFLSVRGTICGVIEQLAPRPQDDVLKRTSWLNLVLDQGRFLHPTGIPQIQAYFRTLIGDASGYGFGRTDFQNAADAERFYKLAAGFLFLLGSVNSDPRCDSQEMLDALMPLNDYVQAFARWRGKIPSSLSEQSILEPFLGSPNSESRLQWPSITDREKGFNCRLLFADAMGHACRRRSFFLTKEGYMGLAPPGAKRTDLLCVLLGCELPLVIRQIHGLYLLIGSCYTYGMMNGEVLKDVEDGKLHTQTITFR